MEQKIINGTEIANKIKDEVRERVLKISSETRKNPCLAVIIVGEDPASQVYVKNKEKACKKCEIKSLKYELPKDTTEEELLALIKKLNEDKEVNGILVQLPLPKHIDDNKVIKALDPKKDIDCFHTINVGNLAIGDFNLEKSILPCTPKGCIKLIKSVCGSLAGKKACIVGRSNIVGKPAAQLLLNEDCTVKIVHRKTENMEEECQWADILVVAVGKPKLIKKNMVKDGAIVIDVGINRTNNGLCGDVDFDDVIDKVGYITPVPGGVGPMTIACLMENVLNAFMLQNGL